MVKEPLSPPFSFSSPSPVLPFGGMVAKPVAGWLADRLARQRLVFLLALLLTGQLTLANFYLLLFPLSPLFPVFRVFYPALSTFSAVVCLPIASTPSPQEGSTSPSSWCPPSQAPSSPPSTAPTPSPSSRWGTEGHIVRTIFNLDNSLYCACKKKRKIISKTKVEYHTSSCQVCGSEGSKVEVLEHLSSCGEECQVSCHHLTPDT